MGKNEGKRNNEVVVGKAVWNYEKEMLFCQHGHVKIHKLDW